MVLVYLSVGLAVQNGGQVFPALRLVVVAVMQPCHGGIQTLLVARKLGLFLLFLATAIILREVNIRRRRRFQGWNTAASWI